MNQLMAESDKSMILWAFQHGLYNIRRSAVHYFIEQKSPESISVLRTALHDDIQVISQEAMSGLEKFGASSEVLQEIAEKRQYWIDENAYREGRRNRAHRKSSVLTESKERGSKKTLDNVRNMLKKPLIGGKWF